MDGAGLSEDSGRTWVFLRELEPGHTGGRGDIG